MILPHSMVGYIDFGITGVISSYMRQHLVALTLAYARGDLDGMFAAFFKVSALDPQVPIRKDSGVDCKRCQASGT